VAKAAYAGDPSQVRRQLSFKNTPHATPVNILREWRTPPPRPPQVRQLSRYFCAEDAQTFEAWRLSLSAVMEVIDAARSLVQPSHGSDL
jgi:hypothetical protein